VTVGYVEKVGERERESREKTRRLIRLLKKFGITVELSHGQEYKFLSRVEGSCRQCSVSRGWK